MNNFLVQIGTTTSIICKRMFTRNKLKRKESLGAWYWLSEYSFCSFIIWLASSHNCKKETSFLFSKCRLIATAFYFFVNVFVTCFGLFNASLLTIGKKSLRGRAKVSLRVSCLNSHIERRVWIKKFLAKLANCFGKQSRP